MVSVTSRPRRDAEQKKYEKTRRLGFRNSHDKSLAEKHISIYNRAWTRSISPRVHT